MPIYLVATDPTLSDVITDVTSVVTAGAGWLGSAASAVMASPIAVFLFAVSFVGIGFGLFKRLTNIF